MTSARIPACTTPFPNALSLTVNKSIQKDMLNLDNSSVGRPLDHVCEITEKSRLQSPDWWFHRQRGEMFTVHLQAVAGGWRHERFLRPSSPTWWNFGIHWQFDESLLCWKYAANRSSFLAPKQSKIAAQPHAPVVLLLNQTSHTSSAITPASETRRERRARPSKSSERALISLGILAPRRRRSFEKPGENYICPNQSHITQEHFQNPPEK